MTPALQLAIIAQAILDALEGDDEAIAYLCRYPKLIRKLTSKLSEETKARWKKDLEEALNR